MTKKFKRVIIDADILLYKAASVCDVVTYKLYNEDEECIGEFDSAADAKDTQEFLETDLRRERCVEVRDIDYGKKTFQAAVRAIQKACNADEYQLVIGGDSSQNFRHGIATVKIYKGTRQQEKPTHFAELKQWILETYKPNVYSTIEADDALCILTRKDFEKSKKKRNNQLCQLVVASTDKDACGTPGWLYNPDKDLEPQWISTPQARHWFYTQLLEGDTVDAIQGCPRIGKAKSQEILEGCKSEWDYWKACKQAYEQAYEKKVDEEGYVHYKHAYTGEKVKKTPEEIAVEMARLLYMLKSEDDVWYPPKEPMQ